MKQGIKRIPLGVPALFFLKKIIFLLILPEVIPQRG